ncbi:hypothetical protein CC86DRAFT_66335 [Ophiobolus disseminans]|uniref:Uncharacterized protein n=1 Tax=Ophiobolus disseminans TaxID=1469910 RepID=A0A6A6ZR89_9PLEO|nr:hypothetical protein CC86DRAFT_66335 [Ophiobolus disseminans]
MVRRIDSNGLSLNLVKLNGKLELRFTFDNTFTAQYTFHGTDIDDTVEMEYAREAAAGQPVVSLGLEMFLENVDGYLEVRFDGAIGSTLSFPYDDRDFDDLPTFHENLQPGPLASSSNPSASAAPIIPFLTMQEVQQMRATTRDAKIQTTNQETRNAKTQTIAPLMLNASIQTKTVRIASTTDQTIATTGISKRKAKLFPTIVDLTEQDELTPVAKMSPPEHPTQPEVAHTFTNAVSTIFQTFNETRDPYRQKRQAEPAADYRAYKHIFIEGYRNGDGKEEEGRLHVGLAHHVLLWESYDDYEGGAKLTLDRLDVPGCEVSHKCLKTVHYFGDHTLQLYQRKARNVIFSMDYKGKETKIYGNNMGNGDERFHFEGEDRVQVVVDAIEDCLRYRAKYVAPKTE